MEQRRRYHPDHIPRADYQRNKEGIPGKKLNAKIYDPLGLTSPITLEGKILYREVCEKRIPWDQRLPQELENCWKTWENNLPEKVEMPRSFVQHQETITSIGLHAFGDASSQGVSTTVYAVTHQLSGASQGLVTAKSRLAKKELTIPRLELVAGHMAANLVNNVKDALKGLKASTVGSIAPLLFTGSKGAETTSSLSAIEFGRSKKRSTSSGGTWDLRKTLQT